MTEKSDSIPVNFYIKNILVCLLMILIDIDKPQSKVQHTSPTPQLSPSPALIPSARVPRRCPKSFMGSFTIPV